jgi:hypothetical protein
MNLSQVNRFGSVFFGLAGAAIVAGATGCASSGGFEGHDGLGLAILEGRDAPQGTDPGPSAGVRAGSAHVVDSHINPIAPVRLTVEGQELAVHYAHWRSAGAVAHLDPTSLAPLGAESPAPVEPPAAPASVRARVLLNDGRFVECWKTGDSERGYRIVAQAWTRGGDSLGAPVTISPADSEVLGSPQLVSVNGNRAVVTFAALADKRAQLLAVPLEVL